MVLDLEQPRDNEEYHDAMELTSRKPKDLVVMPLKEEPPDPPTAPTLFEPSEDAGFLKSIQMVWTLSNIHLTLLRRD